MCPTAAKGGIALDPRQYGTRQLERITRRYTSEILSIIGPTRTSWHLTSTPSNGVLVVPDILADAAGVIVSYFEWVQANQSYWWEARDVEARLEERISAWVSVNEHAHTHDLTLLAAAPAWPLKRTVCATSTPDTPPCATPPTFKETSL